MEYECEICEYVTSYSSTLRQHVRAVHEHSKNHKCEDCGKSFSKKHHLQRHVKTVHGHLKDHKCEDWKEFLT